MLKLRSKTSAIISGNITGNETIFEFMGCKRKFFMKWITCQLIGKQTMSTYGNTWHIDHCLPCSKFDASNEEDIKRCFHWSNTQPVNGIDNQSKGTETDIDEQYYQIVKMNIFLKLYGHKFVEGVDYNLIDYDRYEYINNNVVIPVNNKELN